MSDDTPIRLGVIVTRSDAEDPLKMLPKSTTFKRDLTIAQAKDKLYMIAGTEPQHQHVRLLKEDGTEIAVLDDDTKVLDRDPDQTLSQMLDTSQGGKKEMTDEEYNQREGTYRSWRKENPDAPAPWASRPAAQPPLPAELQDHIGRKCEITTNGKSGIARYVGYTDFAAGPWVGIELDEPTGKNNGTVKDVQYFECEDKKGTFVKLANVKFILDENAADEETEM